MIHLGDITQIHGDEIPVVDIITGGSPCQDLSVAGKRAGLDGERSGLFMEQIRIVKEMRERDRRNGRSAWLIRPRFMVWENVPGAFSSNKGRDFQAVLSEIVKIAEPDAPDVPLPESGRWPKSGCLYQNMGGWSVAWRVHDAQFWGVPQRRKRIALVADFGGLAAPEILFERKGLSGDIEPCGTAREGTAAPTESSAVEASGVVTKGNGECFLTPERHMALTTSGGQAGQGYPAVLAKTTENETRGAGAYAIEGHVIDRATSKNGLGIKEDISQTLNATDRHGVYWPDVAHTLSARHDGSPQPDKGNGANIVAAFKAGNGSKAHGIGYEENVSPTLSSAESGTNRAPCVYDARGNGDGEIAPTMTGDHQNRVTDYTALCDGNGQLNQMSMAEQTVRRLTPLECERLQGFPDGWTDIGEWIDSKGKKHKEADSPRYKALGNSIALPFWQWMARRICAQYERTPTMGSLFDGIGGFPLVFQRSGAVPVWASEIEEFPIAVTKRHFPEEDTK